MTLKLIQLLDQFTKGKIIQLMFEQCCDQTKVPTILTPVKY